VSAYNEEFNKDNVVLRYIIVALLAELKRKIYYYNQVDADTKKKIPIPFYYSVTGNERFLLDNFLYETTAEGKAVGDYELVPRGIVQLSSMSIQSSNLTNKFVRAELVKELDGELKTFSLMTAFLPITLGMEVTIVCSNNLEMLKATEAIISMLYKSQSFSVDLGMIRVQAAMIVPEDFNQERLFEYVLNDKKEFKVTFSLEVQSFIPVFEGGKVTLADVDLMVKDSLRTVTDGSTEDNPERKGIGIYRDGAIYFGNVVEQIVSNIDDIRKAPISSDGTPYSNEGYVNPDTILTGPQFSEDDTTRDTSAPETKESEGFRNAEGEDDPGTEDDLADK
jgi:hypothetical protein|tara:strand:- start:1350 stop:2357 length:1008 start_codon:yes stop_codon:yes gene_type:complete